MMMHAVLMAIFIVIGSCADAGFQGAGAAIGSKKSKTGKPTGGKGPNDPITVDENDNVVRLRYGNAVKPRLADYLFVIDNSISMGDDVAGVQAGLEAITKEQFPESARIAVMTTMAASPATVSAASPSLHSDYKAANRYTCMEKEPGFLDFVNADAVQAFKACGGPNNSAYSRPLCTEKWFAPYDVNSANERCFSAAFQNPRHGVGCEPGLLALKQLFQRNSGKPLFRDNAAVNIIFVSDEMDGCTSADTSNLNASAANMAQEIKDAVLANSKIASIKLHGIIPEGAPDKNANKLSYKPVIDQFSGYSIYITSGTANYSQLIKQVVEDKVQLTSSEFNLPADSNGVVRVEIDGVASTNFEFVPGSRTVKVNGLDPSKPVEIAIRYKD